VVIYRQIIDQASYLKMENTEIETRGTSQRR
jgi:hypothetical protein